MLRLKTPRAGVPSLPVAPKQAGLEGPGGHRGEGGRRRQARAGGDAAAVAQMANPSPTRDEPRGN